MSESTNKIDDGGPAFPVDVIERSYRSDGSLAVTDRGHDMTGMSLRDYFAAKAMQSLLARGGESIDGKRVGVGCLAIDAYIVADAMLAARKEQDR